MDNFLEKINNNKKVIIYQTELLFKLSDSFFDIGNNKLAVKLNAISNSILHAIENIENAISEDMTRQIKLSQQNSATILKATLAGIKLGKEKKDDIKEN